MSDQARTVSLSQSLVLDLPPSCIEFCPAYPDYFIVGTYNLQKDENREPVVEDGEDEPSIGPAKRVQSRNGSVMVFCLQDDAV